MLYAISPLLWTEHCHKWKYALPNKYFHACFLGAKSLWDNRGEPISTVWGKELNFLFQKWWNVARNTLNSDSDSSQQVSGPKYVAHVFVRHPIRRFMFPSRPGYKNSRPHIFPLGEFGIYWVTLPLRPDVELGQLKSTWTSITLLPPSACFTESICPLSHGTGV